MLKRKKKQYSSEDLANKQKQNELFELHWNTTSHYCRSCNRYLGKENKTIFHDHLLEKSKYPELRFEIGNLYLVCIDCHDMKSRGFPTRKHSEAIRIAEERFL